MGLGGGFGLGIGDGVWIGGGGDLYWYGFGGLVWYVAFDGIAVRMDPRTKMSKRLKLKLIFPISDPQEGIAVRREKLGVMNKWQCDGIYRHM